MADKTMTIAVRLDGNKNVVSGLQQTQKEINALGKRIDDIGKANTKVNQQKIDWREMAKGSTSAKMGMVNLQYTLRDAPYLFQNLQMGVTAVGENMLMTVASMKQMKTEAGGMRNFLGMLTGALSGPGGFAVALSAVLFLVQSASIVFGKMKRDAKETGEEVEVAAWNFDVLTASVEDTKKVLDSLSFEQIISGIDQLIAKRAELQAAEKAAGPIISAVGTGGMVIDKKALDDAKEREKEMKGIIEKNAAIRDQLIKDATMGKMSADRIEEVLVQFEAEKQQRIRELEALSPKVVQRVRDEYTARVDDITKQIDALKKAQSELGDLQSIELQLAERSADLKRAKGDEARQAILNEIAALEELQKKYRFEEDKERGKKTGGKSAAELEAEYAAKHLALEDQLAVLQNKKSELQVLTERETQLRAESVTADKERQLEIELELLNIAIDREKINVRADQERVKAAQAHEKSLDELAEKQRENAVKEQELALMTAGGSGEDVTKRRLAIQEQTLNLRKSALQEQLTALQLSLQTGTDMEQEEYDKRLLAAETMKGQIIDIEQQILNAKLSAEQQATDAQQRAATQRTQLIKSQVGETLGMFTQMWAMSTQNMQQERSAQVNSMREKLQQDKEKALSHAKSADQREAIDKQYTQKIEELEKTSHAKTAAENARMFKFQQSLSFGQAQMDAWATFPKVSKQLGFPLGPILGGLYMAASLIYAAKILTAKAPAYASGGLIKVSNGERYFDQDTYEKYAPQLMMLNRNQKIRGAGTGTSDSIFAMADGGFVLNASAARSLENSSRFAAGGDVLNRDFNFGEPGGSGGESANAAAIQNLSAKVETLARSIMYYIKHPPKAEAILSKRESAAVLSVAEYEIARGRLQ